MTIESLSSQPSILLPPYPFPCFPFHTNPLSLSFLPILQTLLSQISSSPVLTTQKVTMATASATFCPAMAAAPSVAPRRQKNTNIHYIAGLNSFGGLKAQTKVGSMGVPVCTHQLFAKMASSLKYPSKGKGRNGGGALASTCDTAGEIFKIAAIINALVLVGVAVGFVLLRIEAFVEESE